MGKQLKYFYSKCGHGKDIYKKKKKIKKNFFLKPSQMIQESSFYHNGYMAIHPPKII